MSYYTRRKQAYLPVTMLDPVITTGQPTPQSSGNAAVGYVSFQEREKFIWGNPRQRRNAFLAADGEEPVASDGIGFGTH